MTIDQGALEHRALFYRNDEDYLTTTVPFLLDRLAVDDIVVAISPAPKIHLLHDALGTDARAVHFIDAAEFYRHPVQVIAAYQDLITAYAPRRLSGVGEADPRTLPSLELTEWIRYEAVLNAAFATSGAKGICAYDTRRADPRAVRAARRTHPVILGEQRPATYTAPEAFAAELDREPLPPPPGHAESHRIEAEDLSLLRSLVAERASRHGLAADSAAKLLVAIDEVAGNALRHGAPPVVFELWASDRYLICQVTDHGHWRPAALTGHLPPAPDSPRFGLWGVRMLVDILQLRTIPTTTVRLLTRLPARRRDAR
ncbi:sensor histidine kinase [Actinoallomurus acanthiterrae]